MANERAETYGPWKLDLVPPHGTASWARPRRVQLAITWHKYRFPTKDDMGHTLLSGDEVS